MGYQDSSPLETALLPALTTGRKPVRTEGTAEGRGPGRRLPPSGGQQGSGSRSLPASPRPGPAPLSFTSAASARQTRRPSANPARGSGRLTSNTRVGPVPSRSTKATLKVFSHQRRPRLRDLAPRRACASVAPEARGCARGVAPPARRAGGCWGRVRQLSGLACACACGSPSLAPPPPPSRRVTGGG